MNIKLSEWKLSNWPPNDYFWFKYFLSENKVVDESNYISIGRIKEGVNEYKIFFNGGIIKFEELYYRIYNWNFKAPTFYDPNNAKVHIDEFLTKLEKLGAFI